MGEAKTVKVSLKLRKRHPRKSFRLGTHVVEVGFKDFDLTEDEVRELNSKGGKAWLISKDEFDKSKKKPAKKEEKKK